MAICAKQLLSLWLEIKGKRLELFKLLTVQKKVKDLKVRALWRGHYIAVGGVSELRKGAYGNGIQIPGEKVLVEQ